MNDVYTFCIFVLKYFLYFPVLMPSNPICQTSLFDCKDTAPHQKRQPQIRFSQFSGMGHQDLLHYGCHQFLNCDTTSIHCNPSDPQPTSILDASCATSKNANRNSGWRFLAGALGLEPRAYGFGDRRSTNWAIPLYIIRQRPELFGGPSGLRTRDYPVMSRRL